MAIPNPFDDFDQSEAVASQAIPPAQAELPPALEKLNPFNEFDGTPTSADITFLNRGISRTLGAPVDIVNAALGLVGAGQEAPFLGSQNIEEAIRTFLPGAVPITAGEQPKTTPAKVLQTTGEAAGFLIPGAAIARGLSAGTGIASNIARDIVSTTTAAPIRTIGAELIGGVGAGAGRVVGEDIAQDIESPVLKGAVTTGAEILGGIAAPATLALGKAAVTKTPLVGRAVRAGKRLLPTAARERATARLEDIVADPELAAQQLVEETLAPLSPAQRVSDKGLLGLEKAVRKQDAKLDEVFRQQSQEAQQQLIGEIFNLGKEGTDISAAREFLQSRSGRLTAALNSRAVQAGAAAEERIAKLTPKQRQTQSSIIVREELNKALTEVRIQEKALWNAIPGTNITTAESKAQFARLLDETPLAQVEDIPTIANKFLNPNSSSVFAGKVKAKELQALRSKLLEEGRIARAAGQSNKARIADDLSDAILEDLGAQAGAAKGKMGIALREALDFTRNAAQTFRQGNVGKILGFERIGGEKIAPELTLETAIGRGGPKGAVATEEILAAAPGAEAGVEDFVLSEFNKVAVRDGELNVKAAQNFLNRNTDLLDRFPAAKQNIEQALGAENVAAARALRAETVGKTLTNAQKSRTAEFLGSPVGLEIDTVMKAKNPALAMKEIRNLVSKNKEALAGLKSGTVEFLLQRSARSFDTAGNPVISGTNLKGILKDKRISPALKQVFSPDEMKRLNKIADELAKVQAKDARDVGAIISDVPNSILSVLGSLTGARLGAKLGAGTGGGQLVLAGEFSRRNKRFLARLTNDKAQDLLIQAIQDPKLMAALLTNTTTTAGRKTLNTRLNAWLATAAGRTFEEQEQQGEQ